MPEVQISDAKSEDWMELAACQDVSPNVFFPDDGAGVRLAQIVCRHCVVREACLEYALENKIDHGVYGGRSERERRRILRQRGRSS